LGGLHSAKILLASVDFHEIEIMQREDDWQGAAQLLGDQAVNLAACGADLILICANTMHKIAPDIEERLAIPLLHIVDPTVAVIASRGWSRVGLLGTRFTMQEDFYRGRLARNFGLDVIVPDASGQRDVDRIIYTELCHGVVTGSARERYIEVVNQLVGEGAEAVIMGCTEIGLLLGSEDADVPLLDTTALHAEAAVAFALEAAPGIGPG
jgi:aspartate racemase